MNAEETTIAPSGKNGRLTLRVGRSVDVGPIERRDREGLAATVTRLLEETRDTSASPRPSRTRLSASSIS
jgi:hypothetical protein